MTGSRKQPSAVEMPSASHAEEHQHDHHRNGDEAAAAVSATTAARRATKVVVEGRHVLGVARGTLAEQP